MPIIISWETTKRTETESVTTKLVAEKKEKKLIQKKGKRKKLTPPQKMEVEFFEGFICF